MQPQSCHEQSVCLSAIKKMIIKAAKRIFNSDKICRSFSDLNFGVTFLEHSVVVESYLMSIFSWTRTLPERARTQSWC